MSKDNFNFEDDGRYYTELAAAFVRGKIGVADALSPEEAIGLGRARVSIYGASNRSSGTPRTLAANCASIALACARRTMRESALFMSKPGPQRWPNGIAPVS
jgi:hypothetical protein